MDFDTPQENMAEFLPEGVVLMTNTSGARNAVEAVRIARLARAAGCGDWIKVEVVSDQKYLLPDNYETIKAVETLAAENFVVLPYITPDLMVAKRLVEVGAAAVMPLGAPIGSNRGLRTKELVRILVEEIGLPVIVDAGIGRPSEAAEAMEMGCAAVLVNTAIATARDPVLMAQAFARGVEAGRAAFLAGLGPLQNRAVASSPLTGFLRE
jgi:thiazole synthase